MPSLLADSNEMSKVGGQALIEGVMMRGTEKISWAVRKSNGETVTETYPFISITKKIAVLGLPIVRGVVGLFESMRWGYRALSRSADIAMEEESAKAKNAENGNSGDTTANYVKTDAKSGDEAADSAVSAPDKPKKASAKDHLFTVFSFLLAFAISISLFMYAPMWIASQVPGFKDNSPFLFNLTAGAVRISLLLIYLTAISMWSETRRLFEYHGAEHKAIHAYEDGKELTADNIEPYTTVHPRCGTSFLVLVALCGILMSSVIDTLHTRYIGEYANLLHRFSLRLIFIPLLAGVSYEALKLSAKYQKSKIVNIIIQPGLWVQKITTRKPDKSQIEVAVEALKAAL